VRARAREAAAAATEHTCPRCGAVREPDQEYCIECGLRLPAVKGPLASARGGWLRRLGWYPGDWIWGSLLALVAAAAAAAVAITLADDRQSEGSTTIVAAGAPLASAAARPVSASDRPKGVRTWPADRSGWTIVLISYPAGSGRAAARATARRAAGLGLPEVGVLDSSDFASLHPGYHVVFSGVYSSRADAEAALASVHASGFGGAYTRQISG
jgi:hypothetical protein